MRVARRMRWGRRWPSSPMKTIRKSAGARVHEAIEEVRRTCAGGSANHHWIAAQVGLGDGSEDAIFFMTNVNELDLAVAPEGVEHRIQCVTDDAVAAFDAGLRQHLPHDICNSSFHIHSLLKSQCCVHLQDLSSRILLAIVHDPT